MYLCARAGVALTFETQKRTVAELFAGTTIYRMPLFQRPYSWEEETAAQLYDDIHAALERSGSLTGRTSSGSEYFLGPVIVAQLRRTEVYDVIDGQQRLVALTIILAIIRDKLQEELRRKELQRMLWRGQSRVQGLDELPRVSLREDNQECFERWVLKDGATRQLPTQAESETNSRLLCSIRRIRSEIGRAHDAFLQRLATFIVKRCSVVQITTHNLDDGYILFRSLNSRGQPLDELDLAKAEILGQQSDQMQEAAALAEAWNQAESEIGQSDLKAYIESILSMVQQRTDDRSLRDRVREVLGDPSRAVTFTRFLSGFLKHYTNLEYAALDFGDDSTIINRVVMCLRSMPDEEWQEPALIWLACQPTARDSLKFFRGLDGLTLGMLILGKTKRQRAKRFNQITQRVIRERETLFTSASSELYLTDEERRKIREILSGEIRPARKFVKPLLLRLNAEMLTKTIPPHFPDSVTIEHILPQRPAKKSEWKQLFPDDTERNRLTHQLGNLTILTAEINRSNRNHDFLVKKQKMFGAVESQLFPLTVMLASKDQWTKSEIEARHAEMMRHAENIMG